MSDEFYNFDEALDQLNLKEEELKRLVSEGEIRAFRDGDTMKLRRQDVESLRGELMGGEVVDLQGAGDEIVFEDDLDLEETGMATEEISEMDTLLEEDVPDVEEEEDFEEETVSSRAPVRRSAPQEETDPEGVFMRAVAILTTLILILSLPIVISISTGTTSDLAASIAGMFTGGGQ
ncbi:MAG TPA: hypothetical protein ENJ09_04505 [Planctomycetes bacterium]|nr:hypothetical protein [Planctomycetota bacterium]